MPQKEFFLKSAEDVVDYIAKWKKDRCPLRIDPHLKKDRAERHVTTRDCDYVLTTATPESLQWPPEWDEKHQNYVLHVRSTDLDGEDVELLFCVDFERATIVVFNWKA
jgi:hypothetical protein